MVFGADGRRCTRMGSAIQFQDRTRHHAEAPGQGRGGRRRDPVLGLRRCLLRHRRSAVRGRRYDGDVRNIQPALVVPIARCAAPVIPMLGNSDSYPLPSWRGLTRPSVPAIGQKVVLLRRYQAIARTYHLLLVTRLGPDSSRRFLGSGGCCVGTHTPIQPAEPILWRN